MDRDRPNLAATNYPLLRADEAGFERKWAKSKQMQDDSSGLMFSF
jgi:hypothetical protein